MLRHNFCWPDGRLVKLLLFSTLLHKSPLIFFYFTTFESKRRVRSPLPTQPNFLVFDKIRGGGGLTPFFPMEKWEKKGKVFISLYFHILFSPFFPMGKNEKTHIFPWAKMELDPPSKFLALCYKRNHNRPSTLSQFVGITITHIC